MTRPYIVCHMMASLDGRIDCDMVDQICGHEYYDALKELDCPSMLNGKVTAVMHYADEGAFSVDEPVAVGRESVYKAVDAAGYHVICDTTGTLRWKDDNLEGKALICLVSEQASTAYLNYLKANGISYIAVGDSQIDLARAMEILGSEFGVKRLVVTGGGLINGSFLAAGLLDEVSMMYAPGIDGRAGWSAAFDGIQDQSRPPVKLKLTGKVRQFDNGTVWMRYLPA